jgi:hypothetical protein
MMEALRSSKSSVLTRATPRNIPEDGILDNIMILHISILPLLSVGEKTRGFELTAGVNWA